MFTPVSTSTWQGRIDSTLTSAVNQQGSRIILREHHTFSVHQLSLADDAISLNLLASTDLELPHEALSTILAATIWN
ncbi:hypothetical protein WJX73_001884 [Symbiochloris irregularis]|uniref:Uncharacterized protein n=1 Tax=Symbiochloris irregularis TaxID=706552 RepID=A0AAW1NKC7_9CHLO